MFAQVSYYRLRPASRDKAIDLMHQMQPKIMAIPGLIRFVNVVNGGHCGYVITLIESAEQARQNEAIVQELWGAFSKLLEEMPVVQGYDVIADWQT